MFIRSLFLGLMTGTLLSSCLMTSLSRGAISASNQTTRAAEGELQGTRSLPPFGEGYRVYSLMGNALGRQYAHHDVIETVASAAKSLHDSDGSVIEVAEIGTRKGGAFPPHATHQNGLSVDIITPMRDSETREPARLTTRFWNLYGYCWRVDDDTHRVSGLAWDVSSEGNFSPCLSIDLESDKEVDFGRLSDLLVALDGEARSRGGKIRYVIVDPSFIDPLSGVGVPLSTRSWIEHDDHIHVEFSFPTSIESAR
jgi:penicillin-insensitive murein endopeptidase